MAAQGGGVDVGRLDPYVLAAVGVAVVIGAAWALARGGRRDAMVALATWCEGHGLSYVASTDPRVVGRFEGEVDGRAVTVEVTRTTRRTLTDLPAETTKIWCRVNVTGGPVVVQPSAWVMTVHGEALPPRCHLGSEAFAQRWAIYAADATAAERLVAEPVQRRLCEADAADVPLSLGAGEVATSQPGVMVDVRELERRLALVTSLSRMIEAAH